MADSVPGKLSISKTSYGDEKVPQNERHDLVLFCDPCSEDGKFKAAEGFCVSCQHYLCDTCFQYHRLPRPMKDHRLLNKQEMPKVKLKSSISDVCHIHDGETIKYFCQEHEEIGCNTCMLIDHKPCEEIRLLTEVAKDFENSELIQELDEWINRTEEIIQEQINLIKENLQTSKEISKRVLESIDNFQKEINDKFQILRTDVVKELNDISKSDVQNFEALNSTIKSAKEQVEHIKNDIEVLKSTNQRKHLFIALKKFSKQQVIVDKMLEEAEEGNKVKEYEFVENESLKDISKNMDTIGEICFCNDNDSIAESQIPEADYPEYGIPKYVPLSKNSFVMADHVGKSLRLFEDTNDIVEHKLYSIPWDVTVAEHQTVAVTLPNKKQVKLITVSSSEFEEIQDIKLNARCEGIAYAENSLYVTCIKPAQVLVLGMDGQMKIRVDTKGDELRYPMFKQPAYIIYHAEQQLLYVSDRKKRGITVLSLDGKFQRKYKTQLDTPLFMAIQDENILVFDYLSRSICSINCDTGETETSDGDIFENDSEEEYNSDDDEDDKMERNFRVLSLTNGMLENTRYVGIVSNFIVLHNTDGDRSDDESWGTSTSSSEGSSNDNLTGINQRSSRRKKKKREDLKKRPNAKFSQLFHK